MPALEKKMGVGPGGRSEELERLIETDREMVRIGKASAAVGVQLEKKFLDRQAAKGDLRKAPPAPKAAMDDIDVTVAGKEKSKNPTEPGRGVWPQPRASRRPGPGIAELAALMRGVG